MEQKKISIYGLIERSAPIKGIRYIGISNNLDNRLMSHLDSSESTPKGQWIDGVKSSGGTVDMIVLDRASTRKEALIREAAWIKLAEDLGWDITNSVRPTGSSLSLVTNTFNGENSIEQMLVNAIYDGRMEAIGFAFENKVDISDLRLRIDDLLSAKGVDDSCTERFTRFGSDRSVLMGCIRHCFVVAAALMLMSVFDLFESLTGLGMSIPVQAMMVVAALSVVYPCFLFSTMAGAWLMGHNNAVSVVFHD